MGGTVTFAVRRLNDNVLLYVNGQAMMGIGPAIPPTYLLPNIGDLNRWYFNGNERAANTVQPVNQGLRHYWKGAVIADDLSEAAFRDLHDVVAHRHGTPALARPGKMRGAIVYGQSWTQGGTTCTDAWRHGPNNWDGMVSLNNATYSGEDESVTREAIPNLYICRDPINYPSDIAPYAISLNAYGNTSSADSHNQGGSGENLIMGAWKQINAHPQGKLTDWHIAGYGAGGASIATLSYQSVVPLVQAAQDDPAGWQ